MLRNIGSVSRSRLVRALMAGCVMAGVASGCGAGNGTASRLPEGPPTDAPPGNLVLYVAMAQGDRVDAYRLGTDGLLPSTPFDTFFIENPRRLALADGVLHVSTEDRILSLVLADNGAMPLEPDAQSQVIEDYDLQEILVRDGVLYAAASGLQRVQSFVLDEDGLVPFNATGNGAGQFSADYVSLAVADGFLYAGARRASIIDTFVLEEDGNVPLLAEDVDPIDRVSLPDDIEVRDGVLYATSGSDKTIRAYRLRADGTVPDRESSETQTEEFYSTFMLAGDLLYAAAYNAGRIDVYDVDASGMLPEVGPIYSTAEDPTSYPNQMILNGGILYVAQAGLDRVDAYIIDSQGRPASFPSSSTEPLPGASFPADLVLHELN